MAARCAYQLYLSSLARSFKLFKRPMNCWRDIGADWTTRREARAFAPASQRLSSHRGRSDTFHYRVAPALALLFALFAPSARAFFDPPWITPAAPIAGETVSVNIRMGICDAIVFAPGFPQLTQDGNAIRILEYGDHVTFDDFCIFDIGTATHPIGSFPPGDYTLTVDFTYDNYPFGPATITLGVIPFTVTGAAPATVPVRSSGPLGLSALLLLTMGLAVWRLRMR